MNAPRPQSVGRRDPETGATLTPRPPCLAVSVYPVKRIAVDGCITIGEREPGEAVWIPVESQSMAPLIPESSARCQPPRRQK